MAKQKKIGIKYFLNKKLKSICKGETIFHPLYVRVHFNGENTNFPIWFPAIQEYFEANKIAEKIHFDTIGYLDECDFERFLVRSESKEVNKEVSQLESQIEEAIRFEYSMLGDKSSLKGFKERFNQYLELFRPFGEKDLIQKLHKEIEGKTKNIPEEVLIYFHDFFLEEFYKSLQKYIGKDLKKHLSADFINQYICFLCMATFEEQLGVNYTILEWVSNLKLQKTFMEFLFDVVSTKGEVHDLANNRLPNYKFDPLIIMGVMKKWLLP
jgi:hypothetical protein